MKLKRKISKLLVVATTVAALSTGGMLSPSAQAAEGLPDSAVHGLKGEYYTNSGSPLFNFGTLKSTVLDPNLDFGSLETAFGILTGQQDKVNVRWTGFIEPEYSEDYTFYITGDNGFRLWVDDKLIIDHWVNDWDKEQVGKPIHLNAGQKYTIKVEYFEDTGGSNIHLRWSSPSVSKSAVPTEALTPPSGFSYGGKISVDGATAEVKLDQAVQALPGGLIDHLKIKVMGTNWPIASASLKPGDDSTLVLTFENPVYSKDVWLVSASYDGQGGLKAQDGTVVPAFDKSLQNESKYQIMTPWASQVTKENVLPEYPRPQLVRNQWQNLNGEWEFQSAKAGEAAPAGQTLKEKILVPFAAESVLSGIHRVENLMWYKRSFTIPSDWSGQRVKLNFGAVDYLATVYVNGQQVGTHKGGYTSFSFDITDQLKPGENELIVQVLDNTDTGEDQAVGKQTVKKLGGIWYTSVSGIWQTVWLEPVAAAHIEKLDMTPDIEDQVLKLTVPAEPAQGLTVEAVAIKDGQEAGRISGPAGEELKLPVPNPRLWSPDDPFLYDLQVQLKNGDQVVDQVSSYFGMREIKLGKVDGITRPLLNGKFVFQMGPLDQGFYPDGIYTAPTDDALKFDIQTVKRIGMNTIRKHIKVEPARWYYWADKLGVLVWQDMPSLEDRQGNHGSDITQAAKTQWLKEYKEMVDQLRSAPSIIEWTVFNEGWGEFDWGGQQTKDAVNYVKSLDSTRLINNASGWQDSGTGDLVDMHSYPAPNAPTPTDTRAAVLGEYGGLGLHTPGHEWSPLVFSYQEMKDKKEITDKYIDFINQLKNLKASPGLSAAIYTQISDVEYEINGLLSYDRKVEKLDFDRIAKAHRELIGTTNNEDLSNGIQSAEQFYSKLQAGDKPGQYPQDALDRFHSVIESAKQVLAAIGSTSSDYQQALNQLSSEQELMFTLVHDPVSKGAAVDNFDSTTLNDAWSIYRPNNDYWSLTSNPGNLTIQTQNGDSYESSNAIKNVFLQNAPDGDFIITTKVTAPVRRNFQQAGLIVWQNEDNYVRFGHVWDTQGATGKSLESAYEKNAKYSKATNMALHPGYDTSYLQIRKVGNVYTTYYWDGSAWKPAADPMTVQLSDLKVGFYAFSTDATSIQAKFDYFATAPVTNDPAASLTGPASVVSGQPFETAVSLDNVTQTVYAQDLNFTYDADRLDFVSASSAKDGWIIVDKKAEPGHVRLITANVSGADASGELFKLQWKAKDSGAETSGTIALSKLIVADGQGNETELEPASLSVRITAGVDKSALGSLIATAQSKHDTATEGNAVGQYKPGSKAALQTAIDQALAVYNDAQATKEQVEQAIVALNAALQTFIHSVNTAHSGDVNGDGKFSVGDLAIVAAAYGKKSIDPDWEQYQEADINNDGIVDLVDLATLAQKILE
ncbi:Evolved beta-galactosidase subunit alpha [Paenibacillus konkukensis]|uniref:Evolved beta-galactosidase subunit alpha n=1 Tax=Paenibacillus konkukensis TaxID=2020716 RepID=A0ABY4RJN4_9BACL|nr:PA14 domain-containing protein [Paenibacillus konkukensis]UQZ82674.1 Evolved beta-galactosidase subunit alpha [Paenibacillus konkukensis]